MQTRQRRPFPAREIRGVGRWGGGGGGAPYKSSLQSVPALHEVTVVPV
jgi:hypothetical protein